MSVKVQLRRDVAANVAAFAGAQGECIIDTTNNRICVQDGATIGGFAAAKLTETQTTWRRTISDANAALSATDAIVAMTSITATRTWTLPAAASYPAGRELSIQDESGAASAAVQISIAAAGGDTIAGVASISLAAPYGAVRLRSNGVNAWFLSSGNPGVLTQAPHGGALSVACLEQLVALSGATTTAGLQIPANTLLLGVSNRVVTPITGATSYSCGIAGSATLFGSSLGVAAGSSNVGMIGPNPIYSATSAVYSAAGGNFTGGAVRMTIHLLYITPATS
jgi:hypothetical protein